MLLQYSHSVCSFVLVVVSMVVEVAQDPSSPALVEVGVVQVLSWLELVVAVEVVVLVGLLVQGLPHENQAAWLFDHPEDVFEWWLTTKNSSSHCLASQASPYGKGHSFFDSLQASSNTTHPNRPHQL